LNDTTHFPTRLVIFEGIDHMMPEIEIDHQWWVFDQVYLTSDRPIISENLSKHISEDTRNNIAFIYYSNKEHSLLKQHGFNETQLTINTILDMPANPMSGKPLKGVNVEIFTTKNSHDPLVAKGITDYNGQFSTLLNSDKEYLIFATYEFLPLFPKFAGTGFIPKSTVNNISITIPITKYG
jgi:5-hydroxyisourate hydrolase-like protein (transthyretin family)